MYFHIFIGIASFTFCLGDPSNQAISSISFHRDDVPLSYKYSSIHIYSTEKPSAPSRPEVYRNIQYAPLVSNHKDKDENDGLYTKAIASKWNKIENVTKSEYLEPQVHNSGDIYGNRQFVAGYNIDGLRYNNLKHNNINSEYKNSGLHNADKQSIDKLVFNTNTGSIPSRSHESMQFNHFLVLNARKQQENPSKSGQVLSVMENAKIHPVFNPYVKVPQLHLNVARAYNFAPTPVKAPLNVYQELSRRFHEQTHLKQINIPNFQKTFLYPLNNNRQ